MTHISTTNRKAKRIDDLRVSRPEFIPKEVELVSTVGIIEMSPRHCQDGEKFRLEWLAQLVHDVKTAISVGGVQLLVDGRPKNPVHEKRGFWNLHHHDFQIGVRQAEATHVRGNVLYLVGILCLESAHDIASQLLKDHSGFHSVMILGEESVAAPVIRGTLDSPNLETRGYFIRTFFPEMLAIAVERGAVVLRLWREHDFTLEIYGTRKTLNALWDTN